MKKMSKRLLSVLLAALLVLTTLPIVGITAFADAESDLQNALDSFETDYIVPLATEGYSALKTNMYDAYEAYLVAAEIRKDGTAAEMNEAREYLEGAIAAMEEFEEPTANAAVKIGTGTSQPTTDDYANILYSDGETNAKYDSTNGATYQYGTTGALGINWEYENFYYFYYPNTVIFYDGETDPKIPVIVGMHGNGSNATLMPQNIYLSSNYFELTKDWNGTTEGGYATSSTRFNSPAWPDLDTKDGSYLDYPVSYRPAVRPYVALDEYNAGRYRWASESTSSMMAFRNSLVYSLAGANEPLTGYSSVDAVRFMGEGSYVWKVTNSWSVKGYRAMEPCDYTATKVHVINYKLIKDNLVALLNNNASNFANTDYIKDGALESIFFAIQKATDFDPNSYDYAAGMEEAAVKCGDEIDSIVIALSTATLDDVDAVVQTLDNVIDRYVDMMGNQVVYTNMLDAYQLYMTAVQYRDALKYGRRLDNNFDPSISEVVYEFDMAIKNMNEVGTENSYTYVAPEAFDGDNAGSVKTEAYKETFNNLVYAGHTPTRMRAWGGETEGDTGNGTVLRINSDYATTYFYVPKAVAVYDGTNGTDTNPFTVPVLVGFDSEGGVALLGDDIRSLFGYVSNTADLPFLYNWKTRTYTPGDEDEYVEENADETSRYVFDVNTKVSEGLKDAVKNGTVTPTRTYIEVASLNELLNADSIAETKDAFRNQATFTSGLVSAVRNDHQGNSDDPEQFYANVMRIKNPYTDSSKTFNTGWQKYYYKYTTINTTMRGTRAGSSVYAATSQDDYSRGIFGVGGYQTYASGTLSNLALYVINYKPVLDRVHAADSLLTDAPLDISKFTEGGLEGYFEDMDKLTACSPNNSARYEFDNDKYHASDKYRLDDLGVSGATAIADGYVASTEQCAYDIWALLDSDTDEALQHLKTDDGGYTYEDEDGNVVTLTPENALEELADDRNGTDGDYKDLKEQLEEKSSEEWEAVGTCQSGVYWNIYEAAVEAGRTAMSNIANPIKDGDTVVGHEGYVDQTITYTYLDDDGEEHTVTVNSIEDAAQAIDAAFKGLANAEKRTRHTVKFDHRAGDKSDRQAWDTGVFICNADNSHKWLYPEDWEEEHDEDFEDNTADMGVYDALQFAYTTIDFERYANDLVIETGKAKFDTVINGGIGDPGETPQEMVDQGITELLTAITNANDVKYSVTYPIELFVIDGDGVTELIDLDVNDIYEQGLLPADVFKFDENTGEAKEVLYGSTLTFNVPDAYKGKIYKWEIWTDNNRDGVYSDCNTKLVKDGTVTGQATTSAFDLAVQSPVKVKAYVAPEATSENDVAVMIENQYGKSAYTFVADKTTEIAVDEANGTLTVGDRSFDISDDLFKIPNYTVKGFDIAVTDEKKTLGDFVNDKGVVEIPIKYELTNKDKTFTLKYNGVVIKEGIQYDEKVKVTSDAGSDFVAIVMKNNAGEDQVFDYLPISYTKSFDYFAVCDMELYDLTSPEMTADTFNLETFYITTENGQEELDMTPKSTTDYDDMDYFRFAIERRKTKMPFVYTIMEKMSEADGRSKYAAHTYFTNIEQIEGDSSQAAEFVEAGTVFTTNATIAADRDAFKEGTAGVYTYKADKRLLDSYFYITASSTKTVYARSYVKYKYQFINSRDDGSTDTTEIEAIIYGDVVNSVDNDNGVYQG